MTHTETSTPPPSSLRDEKGVLSCVLQEGESDHAAASQKLRQLKSTEFYDLRNRRIYAVMRSNDTKGDSLDARGIYLAMKDDCGVEREYLFGLLQEAPSPMQFPIYLKAVKEASVRRKLLMLSQKGVELSCNTKQPMEGMLTEFQDEIRNVIQTENSSNLSLPPIERLEDFLAREIPAPTVLIEGILHQGSKMLISGPSKMGKTWLLMDLAVSVQTGTPLWGLQTSQADVLYINLELQEFHAQKRCKKILDSKNLTAVKGMGIWNLRGRACDISRLRSQLMSRILKGDYGLIIFDPIYKVYGGRDENSVSDIAEIMNELERITNETGAALVYVAHQTKGNQSGKEAIDRISGSGAFARDVDSGLILTEHEGADCYTADAAILRNFPPFAPFVLRWEWPLMVRESDIDPERLKARRSSNPAKHHTVEEILAHVPRENPIGKDILKDNANKAGIALNKINPLINQAIEKGLLFEHLVKRPRTSPRKLIARYPQDLQGNLNDLNA